MAKNKSRTIEKGQQSTAQPSGRPPVVAILGHVDHGKTTLLDYIRRSHVAAKEAGGITQHIGAYQVTHKGRKITFIDTPGHEAFSAMRARGGSVSDVAVLVVAADDGVMPQTKESIAHLKAAQTPFIVAVNKMDLPGTNIDRIKKQLSEEGVLVEGFGGDVVVVPISAKRGEGVDNLLEMVNLVADMQGLKEETGKDFSGVVIESKLDKFKGPVATVLVKEGVLRIGDPVHTKSTTGKVKALVGDEGVPVKEARPSTPVEVLGFAAVPKVGEEVSSKEAETEKVESKKPIETGEKFVRPKENEIRLIIKADAQGSLEAITSSLEKLKKENQQVKIYYSDTGNITDSDILLASATKSLVIGFNANISNTASKLASEEGVLVRTYNIIYELIDELEEGLEAISRPEVKEEILGNAEILKIFTAEEDKVAGCRTISGRINKGDLLAIKRDGKEIGRSKIVSMKHRDSNINEANEGEEFGLIFEKKVPFAKSDIIVAMGSSVN
ncbi:MAG: translation initiation factor IF-2 [Candidatus Woykebacteria bacterium]